MINWFRNKIRARRLFLNSSCQKRFICENMKNRLAGYMMQVTVIKYYMHVGEAQEVATRSKHLQMDGLTPPRSLIECDEMVRDLKEWRL